MCGHRDRRADLGGMGIGGACWNGGGRCAGTEIAEPISVARGLVVPVGMGVVGVRAPRSQSRSRWHGVFVDFGDGTPEEDAALGGGRWCSVCHLLVPSADAVVGSCRDP